MSIPAFLFWDALVVATISFVDWLLPNSTKNQMKESLYKAWLGLEFLDVRETSRRAAKAVLTPFRIILGAERILRVTSEQLALPFVLAVFAVFLMTLRDALVLIFNGEVSSFGFATFRTGPASLYVSYLFASCAIGLLAISLSIKGAQIGLRLLLIISGDYTGSFGRASLAWQYIKGALVVGLIIFSLAYWYFEIQIYRSYAATFTAAEEFSRQLAPVFEKMARDIENKQKSETETSGASKEPRLTRSPEDVSMDTQEKAGVQSAHASPHSGGAEGLCEDVVLV